MAHTPPDALLLLAPGCVHCPVVLEGLSQLVKGGKLGRLEVVNVMAHPEISQQHGVRSVPWCRIGPFELDGLQNQTELAKWTEHAAAGSGLSEYYAHLLETQRPHRVAELIARQPESFEGLLSLLEDSETPMTVRIGIGVVLEDLQDSPLLLHALPVLIRLADSAAANVRADAAHYMGLTRAPEATVVLQNLLHDENPDVREIAAESIAQIDTAE
jgi:hypothetical protein